MARLIGLPDVELFRDVQHDSAGTQVGGMAQHWISSDLLA